MRRRSGVVGEDVVHLGDDGVGFGAVRGVDRESAAEAVAAGSPLRVRGVVHETDRL